MDVVWLGRKTKAPRMTIPVALDVSNIYLFLLLNLFFYTECPSTIIFVQKRMEWKVLLLGCQSQLRTGPLFNHVRRIYIEG